MTHTSGDGLGIHQPGSNTQGFAIQHQAPSGRARNRAKCPAVTRSPSRGAHESGILKGRPLSMSLPSRAARSFLF
jgi:hypothetical protein